MQLPRKYASLSENRVVLSVSTLYTTLKRLLENGWIERVGADPAPELAGHPRKTYALTERGQCLLACGGKNTPAFLAGNVPETACSGKSHDLGFYFTISISPLKESAF